MVRYPRRGRYGRKRMYRGYRAVRYVNNRLIPGGRKVLYKRNKSGFMTLIRKTPRIQIQSSNVAGTPTLVDGTGTCVVLGAPEPVSGVSNTWNIPFTMKFRMSQIISSTDITNLADQYKLVSALVKIHNNYNNVNTANNVLAQPYITYTQDYDDNTNLTVDQLREKMGVRTKYFNASKPVIGMGVRPCARYDLDVAGVPTPSGQIRPKWINCAYPNVDHYGIKGVLHNVFLAATPAPSGSLFDVEVSLKLLAKDFQ